MFFVAQGPLFLDLPVVSNPIEAAHQAKIAKALPHLFPDLRRHRFLAYMDDKKRIPHEKLTDFREALTRQGGALALMLSQHAKDTILWEFTDALLQDRYRAQSHRMLRFMLDQIEADKTLASNV